MSAVNGQPGPNAVPKYVIYDDGTFTVDGKTISVARPQSEMLATLQDLIILLATACGSAVAIKKAIVDAIAAGKA